VRGGHSDPACDGLERWRGAEAFRNSISSGVAGRQGWCCDGETSRTRLQSRGGRVPGPQRRHGLCLGVRATAVHAFCEPQCAFHPDVRSQDSQVNRPAHVAALELPRSWQSPAGSPRPILAWQATGAHGPAPVEGRRFTVPGPARSAPAIRERHELPAAAPLDLDEDRDGQPAIVGGEFEFGCRRLEGRSDQGVFKLTQAMGGGKTTPARLWPPGATQTSRPAPAHHRQPRLPIAG
jgi:hypothetical protein